MNISISIEGIDAVISALEAKAVEVNAKLPQGIAQGCEIVKGEAKAICPVSTEATRPGGPHGELRESIIAQAAGTTGTVGTNKEYAAYVEFGTCKMAAQPYLVPALESKAEEVVQAIRAAIL